MTNILEQHQLQPKRTLRKGLIVILGLIVLVICMSGGWFWYGIYVPASNEESVVTVDIESGTGVKQIAEQMKEQGLIRNPFLFVVYAQYTDQAANLKAGTYQVAKNSSLREIVDQVVGGKVVSTDVKVTMIEGWTAKDLKVSLKEKGFAVNTFDEFVTAGDTGGSNSIIFQGKPATAGFEGYLYPETYHVSPEASATEIVSIMIDELESQITEEMRQQIVDSEYTFYELLTLASIVEKEVIGSNDKRTAAGVFFNRLADGYPLESDATVSYGIGKSKDLTLQDLQSQSPYNTYQHVGLPIGPISNPSLESLQAVLNPIKTNYYFFLTTPLPEAKALFSETYEQHLQYKAQYYP